MKITIIGGGPGGYVAALKAAIMGADVTLVEKNDVGGTCLNRGCIPTKVFLQSMGVLNVVNDSSIFGIETTGKTDVSYGRIYNRKNAIVKQLVSGVQFLLKKRNIKLCQGIGELVDEKTVKVTFEDGKSELINSDAIILATGSVPVIPQTFPYDGERIISSDEVLEFKDAPKSIIIVGGGVIGCELGQFLSSMGSKVTIVEMEKQILPFEDKDVSSILEKKLKKSLNIYSGIKVESTVREDNVVKAKLSNGEIISADYMMVAIGRKPYLENLGVNEVGIETERGTIVVNNKMETNIPNIYAIGDIVNTPQLAHVASKEGMIAVENIFGNDKIVEYKAVPRCVYTNPEIATVGLTEEQAKNKGLNFKKGMFNFAGIGKSTVIGETEGFVKVIADEKDCIVGGAIVGPHATELLTELTLGIHLGLTVEQLGDAIYPHPTLSEALIEALHDVHDCAVHSY